MTTEVVRVFKAQQLRLALKDELMVTEGAAVGQELVSPPVLGNGLCSLGKILCRPESHELGQ